MKAMDAGNVKPRTAGEMPSMKAMDAGRASCALHCLFVWDLIGHF